MTEPSHAVFLSYASQDQEAAQRIRDALRTAGIEVWFDQSALRGGDVWDQVIRKQIKTCVLFIPVISRHTHERDEGYFRLEWKLAVDRSHLMTADKAFLLPVVIDDTREDDARVPDKFREVHWTRLPQGDTPPAFVERVRRLVSQQPSHNATTVVSPASPGPSATPSMRERLTSSWSRQSRQLLLAVVALVVTGALAYLTIDKLWVSKHRTLPPTPLAVAASEAPATFSPPPHSIAVLPFVNLSGDARQDYFCDGLTEELLNSLAAIDGLQVAARTSSFSFREHPDIVSVAHKLNVGAVLEGSVRRSANSIRVTAQLINSVSGFHLWSKTYDRDLGEVLKLQTEIATTVANALKVTLLGDVATKIELGGTRTPAAFDAYLRASKVDRNSQDARGHQEAIAAYTEAINLDPGYALAYAGRSEALIGLVNDGPPDGFLDRARSDALRAIALAPDLAEGHLALAWFYGESLDFVHANDEIRRALALAPGKADVLLAYGRFLSGLGHGDEGIAAVRRAVALDPLNVNAHIVLANALSNSRHFNEAISAFRDAMTLDPDNSYAHTQAGHAYYFVGNFEDARTLCEAKRDFWHGQQCLALVYEKLGRHNDAEAMLAKLRAIQGDDGAYIYALVYAQWGNIPEALKWLDVSFRRRDNPLVQLKTDPGLDPLRKEPRFQAIEKALFPG